MILPGSNANEKRKMDVLKKIYSARNERVQLMNTHGRGTGLFKIELYERSLPIKP